MLKERRNSKRFKSKSHSHAPQQESNLANVLGGDVVKGSGCGYNKGDVVIEGVVKIECKSTIHKSFSVTKKIIDKVNAAAVGAEVPVIQIDLIDGETGVVTDECYVVPKWAMELLILGQRN